MCKGAITFPTRGISANLHAFAKWYCQQLIVIAGLTPVVSEVNSVLLKVENFSIYSFSHPVASFKLSSLILEISRYGNGSGRKQGLKTSALKIP